MRLIETRLDALTKPERFDHRATNLIDAIAKLQFSTLEFKDSWTRNGDSDKTLLPALADLLRVADAMVESTAGMAIPWKLYERLGRMNSGAMLPFDSVVNLATCSKSLPNPFSVCRS